MTLLLLAGCAGAVHYKPVDFALAPVAPEDLDRLADDVRATLGTRRIRAWSADGDPALDELPPEALYAMWATAVRANRGAELDLWVDVGAGPRAITLWWGIDRSVRVAVGVAAPSDGDALEGAPHPSGFAGDWSPEEIRVVSAAVGRLAAAERGALAGIVMVRGDASPRSARRELAYFDPKDEPPSLWFFDPAFEPPTGFVGPADAPVPPAAMTALHEIGHLIADVPFRRAYRAYLEAAYVDAASCEGDEAERRAVVRERFRSYRSLGSTGPVIDAWEAFRAGRRGPSTYGWRSPQESFAEAFALWHLDPEALERALPGAVAWFGAGTHTAAAGLGEGP